MKTKSSGGWKILIWLVNSHLVQANSMNDPINHSNLLQKAVAEKIGEQFAAMEKIVNNMERLA